MVWQHVKEKTGRSKSSSPPVDNDVMTWAARAVPAQANGKLRSLRTLLWSWLRYPIAGAIQAFHGLRLEPFSHAMESERKNK